MNILIKLFIALNIPTNKKKCVGPAQTAIILGWKCTTIPFLAIGISKVKSTKYLSFLNKIYLLKLANLKQFEKLIGYTVHICTIFFNAKCFIRGFTKQKCALLKQVEDKNDMKNKFSLIYLSPESLFDLNVWIQLLSVSKNLMINLNFILKSKNLKKISIWTDASTSYGFGGYSSENNLFHLPIKDLIINKSNYFINVLKYLNTNFTENIIYLELFAIIIMAAQFAHLWRFKFITLFIVITLLQLKLLRKV